MKFRHRVEYTPDEPITHVAAGQSQIMVATKDRRIVAIDLLSARETDCDLNRHLGTRLSQSRLYKMFLDPMGKFCLISLAYATDNQPMENLLFVKRIQALPRLKNHLVSAVAWNTNSGGGGRATTTGTILLGTTKGVVLQTELVYSDESKFFPLSTGPIQYVKEVFEIGPDLGAIIGLDFHQIPSSNPAEKTYVITVATNNRLYRMAGSVPQNVEPPPLHLIFAQNATSYSDVPGRNNFSKIDFFYPAINGPPTRFAWLTEPGLIIGEFHTQLEVCRAHFESNDDVMTLPYNVTNPDDIPLSTSTPLGMSPPFLSQATNYTDKPISVIATSFHVIILFRSFIKVLCVLNEATIYEEYFLQKYGKVLGMCKDPTKSIVWVYCDTTVLRYKISGENKNIWKIYLDQSKFELAKKYSVDNPNNLDRVICEEALFHFRAGDFLKSAEIFARSRKLFEEVALMFMEISNHTALKRYLLMRLDHCDQSTRQTQLVMLLSWLLEIILSSKEQDDLEQLLNNGQVIKCMKQYSNLFYGIIVNHSDLDTFVKVAKLIGDHERLIQHFINLGEFKQALEIMMTTRKNDYFYTYGHVLMKRIPRELVDALIEQSNISPSKLIPVLIQENPYFNKCSETIRYLEYCVKVLKCETAVVHNYLFELYARHRDEAVLIDYLNYGTQQLLHLDLQRCLRLCTELKLQRTCVVLYSTMGLHDEAVRLALNFDIELAKSTAQKVESDYDKKRLWLNIAQNVLSRNQKAELATNLLEECDLLKIEDILPFFPDLKTIDPFRDSIRQSLLEYKNQIVSLKERTKDYDKMAGEIRSEIQAFRKRYSVIKRGQKCDICKENLLGQKFFVFPCGHLFHYGCIVKELFLIDPDFTNEQVEQLVSKECIHCGSLLIDYIQKPPEIDTRWD